MTTMRTAPVLRAGDDIHRLLLGLVLLDAIGQATAAPGACVPCRLARGCPVHERAEAVCSVYSQALGVIEDQAGTAASQLSPALAMILTAAARDAAAARSGSTQPLDAVLRATYGALTAALGGQLS